MKIPLSMAVGGLMRQLFAITTGVIPDWGRTFVESRSMSPHPRPSRDGKTRSVRGLHGELGEICWGWLRCEFGFLTKTHNGGVNIGRS